MVARTENIVVNPIGIISKQHQPGKFRLIIDLSAPKGKSVNDGIPTELCSLEYISAEEATRLAQLPGRGSLMAKPDLQSAYRMVPVHRQDQPFPGLKWKGSFYVDKALPFGLRSPPKIFTAVADGLAWAMLESGINHCLHYLDDFFCGTTGSKTCQALHTAIPHCNRLGLPVAPQKVEGPSTVICFLGIEIDLVCQELQLPQIKLLRIKELLTSWSGRHSASKHKLQCLLGHPNHVARIVKPGRVFLRELINTMAIPKHSFHKVRINKLCRADIARWLLFISS